MAFELEMACEFEEATIVTIFFYVANAPSVGRSVGPPKIYIYMIQLRCTSSGALESSCCI